jgi:hypothetical protein
VKTTAQLVVFGLALLAVALLGTVDDIIRHGWFVVLVACLVPVAFWLGRRSRGTNFILAGRVKYRRLRHYGRTTR